MTDEQLHELLVQMMFMMTPIFLSMLVIGCGILAMLERIATQLESKDKSNED